MKTVLAYALAAGLTTLPVFASASETTSPPPELSKEVDTKLPIGPLLLGSFGLVTVAVGAGFGWQAWEENKDFNEKSSPAQGGGNLVYPMATDDLADDIKTHAITADVLMFGGAALTAGSIIWWLLTKDDDNESRTEVSTAKWQPVLAPGHAGLHVRF